MEKTEENQEVIQDKIQYNEEPYENQTQEEPQEEIPQKVYQPPCPTIKECIVLHQFLPISEINKNIDAISAVIYENDDLLNEFLQKVDNRTTLCNDDPKGTFIKCEQNRDGDSYRSPLSNKYFPPTNDAKFPSPALRQLEEKLNRVFQIYLKNYYSTSAKVSVYCWELGENIKEGFSVAVVIKNSLDHEQKVEVGSWDSSNIITVTFEDSAGKIKAKYNAVTTINISLAFKNKICGHVSLSGSLARSARVNKTVPSYTADAHIENIGTLVEDLETNMRSTINTIYVMKSKEIIDTARYNPTYGKPGIEQAQALKNAFFGKK